MKTSKRITAAVVALAIAASPAVVSAQSSPASGVCNRLTAEQCTKYTADLVAWRVALVNWNRAIVANNAAHRTAMKNASSTLKSALAAANLLEPAEKEAAVTLAYTQFRTAVVAANAAHKAGRTAIGLAPKQPKKPSIKPTK